MNTKPSTTMIRSNTFLLAVCAIASLANAQTLERQVIATAGSSSDRTLATGSVPNGV